MVFCLVTLVRLQGCKGEPFFSYGGLGVGGFYTPLSVPLPGFTAPIYYYYY